MQKKIIGFFVIVLLIMGVGLIVYSWIRQQRPFIGNTPSPSSVSRVEPTLENVKERVIALKQNSVFAINPNDGSVTQLKLEQFATIRSLQFSPDGMWAIILGNLVADVADISPEYHLLNLTTGTVAPLVPSKKAQTVGTRSKILSTKWSDEDTILYTELLPLDTTEQTSVGTTETKVAINSFDVTNQQVTQVTIYRYSPDEQHPSGYPALPLTTTTTGSLAVQSGETLLTFYGKKDILPTVVSTLYSFEPNFGTATLLFNAVALTGKTYWLDSKELHKLDLNSGQFKHVAIPENPLMLITNQAVTTVAVLTEDIATQKIGATLYDTDTLTQKMRIPSLNPDGGMVISPNGNFLATLSQEEQIVNAAGEEASSGTAITRWFLNMYDLANPSANPQKITLPDTVSPETLLTWL